MKTLKKITAILCILLTNFFIYAQDNLRLEVVGDGITTQTVLDQGFEAGFGTFSTNGDVTWAIQNSEVYDGSFSAQSGALTGDGQSNISVTVNIPDNKMGILKFYARFDNNYYYYSDYTLTVDGNSVWSTGNMQGWEEQTVYLEPGSHNLVWSVNQFYYYYYYGGGFGGQVTGWLDNVSITYQEDHAVRIKDGNEGVGKIFTSDSQGNATWLSANSIFKNDANLPLNLVGNTNSTLLNIDQSGSGGGISLSFGPNNFSSAVTVSDAYRSFWSNIPSSYGFYSGSSGYMGFRAVSAGSYGYYSSSSGNDGFYSSGAGDDSFVANNPAGVGFYSNSAGEQGVLSSNAAGDGISSANAGGDGISSLDATGDGLFVSNAGGLGIRVDNSASTNFYSLNAGLDGFSSNSADDYGFYAYNPGFYGLLVSSAGSYGVYVSSATTYAGRFNGDVSIIGALSKSSGTFKIDHPEDPENKYLYHSFVESPDMMNIYNGNVVLDNNGEAVVGMPGYFDDLNKEFRYQLTCIGGFANVYVKEEMEGNIFTIAGGAPGLKVSWQVTGVRQDPYAEQNRVQVEVDKEEEFKGLYLHPEVYGLDENKGIDFNIEKRDNERRAAKETKINADRNDISSEEKIQRIRDKAIEEEETIKSDAAYEKEMEELMKASLKKEEKK